jgi:hypothetical protein
MSFAIQSERAFLNFAVMHAGKAGKNEIRCEKEKEG